MSFIYFTYLITVIVNIEEYSGMTYIQVGNSPDVLLGGHITFYWSLCGFG